MTTVTKKTLENKKKYESTTSESHMHVPPYAMLAAPSLGTRPSNNRKGGSGKLAGLEVYTAPGMKAHFRLAFV